MGKGGLRRTVMAGGSLEEYCGRIDVNGFLFVFVERLSLGEKRRELTGEVGVTKMWPQRSLEVSLFQVAPGP